MLVGIFSRSVQRCPVLMQNPYYVYDITVIEWEKRSVIKQEGKVYLCKCNTNYEVVCKRDLCYIIVVFTSDHQANIEAMYDVCRKLINQMERSIPWLHKANTIAIYKEIMSSLQTNSNWTATHIAAKIGLDVFFDNNSQIHYELNQQMMPDMMTPLHLAIKHANQTVVKALVDHGPNLDLVDINGFNALHFAAISSPEILMFLLSLPNMFERVRAKTKKGCTPLHLACYSNKLENVNIFLRFGLTVSMLTVVPPYDASKPPSESNIKYDVISPPVDAVVKITDKDIDEFELDLIPQGGTPLHWAKRQSEVDRFIELGFDINAPNLKGDTALMLKARRMRFRCLMSLLCQKADVNRLNSQSNSALYYAVRQGDITFTQALIVFDANIDHVNKQGESIRHVAATMPEDENNITHKMVLYVLSALGAKRCPPTMQGCTDGCSHNGMFDGKRFIRWPVFCNNKFYKNLQLKDVIQHERTVIAQKDKSKLINMVGFDGGGIKGLITIQMVHELQKQLKHKFIDYFDWISGTSTGSIIATSLILGKTTEEIRSIYFRFKDKVMTGVRPYNSELIEKLLKDEMGSEIKMGELFEKYHKYLIIPATLIDRLPAQLHIFRNYPSADMVLGMKPRTDNQLPPLPDYKDQLVWKAIRASCAAPTYFNACGPFVDGGLVANNPTMDMLVEFQTHNYALKLKNNWPEVKMRLNSVVSFGTGHINPKPFTLPELSRFISWNPREITSNVNYVKEMFNIIIDSACNSDYHVVERIESWSATNKVPFFRINPDLIEIVSLNETEDAEIVNCLWMTKVYMYTKKDAIEELVYFLESSYHENEQNEEGKSNKKTTAETTITTTTITTTSSTTTATNCTNTTNRTSSSTSMKETKNENKNLCQSTTTTTNDDNNKKEKDKEDK